MTSLGQIDRRLVTWRFDAWDCDLVFQPISAKTLVALHDEFGAVDGEPVGNLAAARFYAALLAASCVSHAGTADEWLECQPSTLLMLGQKALEVNGLVTDQAKKN